MPPGTRALSRRQIAIGLTAALPLSAQLAAPPTTPAPADPAARLSKAVGSVREVSERLAQIEVPMNVEPAFLFRP